MCHVDSSPYLSLQNGFTPLMVASYRGFSYIVELLIEKGAAINTTTQVGYKFVHAKYYKIDNEKAVQYTMWHMLVQPGQNPNKA